MKYEPSVNEAEPLNAQASFRTRRECTSRWEAYVDKYLEEEALALRGVRTANLRRDSIPTSRTATITRADYRWRSAMRVLTSVRTSDAGSGLSGEKRIVPLLVLYVFSLSLCFAIGYAPG